MSADLTAKQRAVLAWIEGFIASEHVPPTLEQISDAFGWRSRTSAVQHVQALIRKGRLERVRAQGLRIVTESAA